MFTVRESALLGRMLRFMGWAFACVVLGTAAYLLLR